MTITETRTDTFPRYIEGSRGTAVFGAGVPAITGEILETREDYIELCGRTVGQTEDSIYVIPVSAIVYWRFDAE